MDDIQKGYILHNDDIEITNAYASVLMSKRENAEISAPIAYTGIVKILFTQEIENMVGKEEVQDAKNKLFWKIYDESLCSAYAKRVRENSYEEKTKHKFRPFY